LPYYADQSSMNLMVIETLFSHVKSVIHMYKTKRFLECEMTIHKKLKALVLLCTLNMEILLLTPMIYLN
jgi:hypothetical protein